MKVSYSWLQTYFKKKLPVPEKVAEVEIRQQRFEPSRKQAFLRWADGYVAHHVVERNDALLTKIDFDSLLGEP